MYLYDFLLWLVWFIVYLFILFLNDGGYVDCYCFCKFNSFICIIKWWVFIKIWWYCFMRNGFGIEKCCDVLEWENNSFGVEMLIIREKE